MRRSDRAPGSPGKRIEFAARSQDRHCRDRSADHRVVADRRGPFAVRGACRAIKRVRQETRKRKGEYFSRCNSAVSLIDPSVINSMEPTMI